MANISFLYDVHYTGVTQTERQRDTVTHDCSDCMYYTLQWDNIVLNK